MEKQNKDFLSDYEISSEEVYSFLKKIKFRKKLFGGVDEYDVWKKIRKLDEMYSEELKNQRIKYEALLAERDNRLGTSFKNDAEDIANGK